VSGFILITTIIKNIYHYVIYKQISPIDICISFAVIITSSVTLFSHDLFFVQWKGMTITLAIGLFLLLSKFFLEKPAMHYFLRTFVKDLSDEEADVINFQVALLFLVFTAVSLYIWFFRSEEEWFFFKTFLVPILSGLYAFCQLYVLIERLQLQRKIF